MWLWPQKICILHNLTGNGGGGGLGEDKAIPITGCGDQLGCEMH
jgi:hypothetical protein